MPMTLESAPDITPIQHDRGHETAPAAPSDAEATALVGDANPIADPTAAKSSGDLAGRPVRDFKDLGTGTDPRPVIPLKDVGTDKDPRPQHPLSQHLLDEHSGPVRKFGETADKAELPPKSLGARAMAATTEIVRPGAADKKTRTSPLEPAITPLAHREHGDAHAADVEHTENQAASGGEHGADQRHNRDEEADEGDGEEGGDHPEDDALLAALFLPMVAMAIRDAEGSGDEPAARDRRDPEDHRHDREDPETRDEGDDDKNPPEDGGDRAHEDGTEHHDEEPGDGGEGGKDNDPPRGGGGDGGGDHDEHGPGDGDADGEEPEDGDHHNEEEQGDGARGETATDDDTSAGADDDVPRESAGDDDDERPHIPRQHALEERALAGDTEATEADDAAAEAEEKSLLHAATLADLRELAQHTEIVAPSQGKQNGMRLELRHDHQDAGEYLSDLYQGLREGSAELPPITNWREEITSPEQLREGQIIHVASLRELDQLMERVGGWLNRDAAEARGVIGGSRDFPPGKFVIPGQKPSEALSRIRDFKGRPFHGRITNVEAMPLPATVQGPTANTRYFTVSAQLQTTGRAPEPERPTWLYGVRAGERSRGANALQARHGNIGRVPASAVAWRVQARARHHGTEVERRNRMFAIRSGMRGKSTTN